MSKELNGVINARLEKVEKELAELREEKRALIAKLVPRENELMKQRTFYEDLMREAGLLPPEKPKGNPNFRKKPTE